MNRVGLVARSAYAAGALVLVGIISFYIALGLLPRWDQLVFGGEASGREIFMGALGVASLTGFTAMMVALTLPWRRRKRKSGRGMRVGISSVLVVVASLGFAGQGHSVVYDLAFAAWLAYVMTFTFVRYGVLDRGKRTPASYEGPRESDPIG